MNFKSCSKCGSNRVVGPRLVSRCGHESLRYVCVCGHSWAEPTLDSERTAPKIAAQEETK